MSNVLQNTGGNTLKVHGGGVFGSAAAAVVSALFVDDFSTGDLSKSNDYFRWDKDGSIPSVGAAASSIKSVLGPDGLTNVNAFELKYVADTGHWQEFGYSLTESSADVRTSGASNTYYDDVWIAYDMFVPANFTHRASGTGVEGGANQKGWMYIWQGPYESQTASTGTQSATSFQWWPASARGGVAGESFCSLMNGGHSYHADYRAADYAVPDRGGWAGEDVPRSIVSPDKGTWVRYIFHFYAGSVAGANDGQIEVFKDGVSVIRWDNRDTVFFGADKGRPLGYDRGYIMGYHNATYAADTTYYITGFKFGLSKGAVE